MYAVNPSQFDKCYSQLLQKIETNILASISFILVWFVYEKTREQLEESIFCLSTRKHTPSKGRPTVLACITYREHIYTKRNLPRLTSKYIENSAIKYVMLYTVGILFFCRNSSRNLNFSFPQHKKFPLPLYVKFLTLKKNWLKIACVHRSIFRFSVITRM